MKLLVLTALVATCACWPTWGTTSYRPAIQYQTTHTKYEPGTVYEYQYESQVMTGLPTFSKQYAGIKIRCDLTLTVGSADWMTLKMKNVRVYSLNNEIQESYNLPPTMQLPLDKFEELPSDHSRLIQGKLLLPLEFEYKDNKVVSMKVADEETNWSIDIKRVVLSMFQVRLQSKTPSVDRLLQYSDLSSQNTTTFDDLEAGLEGSCYSTFHTYVDEKDEANTYRVVKFRDQAKCVKLNALDKNAFQQRQSNCDCRGNMNNEACQCAPISSIRNSTEFVFSVTRCDYELSSENEKDLVIKSAVMSVEHKMEMPNAPHKFLLTTSNQTLIMTGEKPAPSSRSQSVTMKTVSEPWRMEILKKDEEKLMMTEAELLQQTEKQLQEIEAVASVPERFEDHVPLFLQLQANVRLCTRPQLDSIYSKLQNKPAMRKQLQTFLDVLKTANTTEADNMLIEKIGNGELTTEDARAVLIHWTAEKVPTLEMLEKFKKTILPSDYTTAPLKKTVYQNAMLCFGSMIRRYIHNEEILIDQCVYPADKALHQGHIEECHKHEKYVEGRLKAAKNDEEKITCLKTFANMGSIGSLATVIRPYMAKTESKIVRIEAINSLIYLGIQDQLQVLQTLMPIMMNKNEETSVRVAAFVVLMKCRSSTPLIELQKCLNEEPDVEFKTFVVQYLKNCLEKQQQQDQRHQMRIRETLKSVRAFRMSYRTSDWQMLYGWNSQGEMTKISRVESTSGRIPEYASSRQYTQWNGQYNHFIEFGYRAEGMEELFNPSSQHSEQSLLNLLRNSKPSLTLYWKILGQEVSFIYIDSTTCQAWLRQSMSNNGVLEIPVKMFNTMWMQPRRIRTLLPSGGYLIHENTPLFVLDVEGTIKVNFESLKRLPSVTFESSKPIRASYITHQSYHMDMGFSYSGFRSSVTARSYSKSPETVCALDWQQSYLACNWTNPADNKYNDFVELLTRSVTFVQPKRLPVTAARFMDTCKELKVDESGRRQFTMDLPVYKSIEMEGKLDGDLNKPERQCFAYKQHLKLSFRPAIPAVKKICSRYSSIFFNSSDIEHREHFLTQEYKYRSSKNSLFGYLFNAYDSLDEDRTLYMPSLSAMGHNISCSLATVLDNRVLNMSANWTTYYEPDQPQSKSLWCLERPPIKPAETEYMQLVNKITSTLDSGNGHIMQTHEINWGSKSQPEQHGLTATIKFRPTSKDNICHNSSVYGCKDDYGVFTPIWYNNSMHVETRNVEIPPNFGRNLSMWLMNFAQSVFVYPNENRRRYNTEKTIDIDFVVRPMESQVDVILRDPEYIGNYSRIYAPVFTKLNQYVTENRQPNMTLFRARSSIHSLPSYDHGMRYYDVTRRHVCNYAYPSVLTFDQKHLSLPKTSCEVVLARNCQSGKANFAVTVQPSQSLTAPKILKVNIGSQWIEVESVQNNKFQVKINGTIRPISELVHVPIWDQRRQVALVECQGSRFELYSYEHGAYVKLYNGILTVEVQENQKDEICGICSPESQLPSKPSNDLAQQIAQQYAVKSGCPMTAQPTNQYSKDGFCQREQKYRYVSHIGEVDGNLYSCVTAERYYVCSDACSYYTRRFITVPARCVSDKVAKKMNIYPFWQAEELVFDDEQTAQKIYYAGHSRNVRISVQDRCSQ